MKRDDAAVEAKQLASLRPLLRYASTGRTAAESALVRGLSDAEKLPISQFAGPSTVAQVFGEHAPVSLVDATIGIRCTAGIVAGSLLIGPGVGAAVIVVLSSIWSVPAALQLATTKSAICYRGISDTNEGDDCNKFGGLHGS